MNMSTDTLVERLRTPSKWCCIFEHEGAARHGTTDAPFEAADRLESYAVLVERLDDLQQAEFEYRLMHDRHGGGATATGRAWDLMKRAGDKAREALCSSSVGG